MNPQLYWHAPLWEVLLITLFGLTLLSVLLARALRPPKVSSALRAIDPILDEQPLFFLNQLEGVQPLNHAAEQTLAELPAAQKRFLLDVLTDVAAEALTEGRQASQESWPQAGQTVIATPLFTENAEARGTLVTVVREAAPDTSAEAPALSPTLSPLPATSLPSPAPSTRWVHIGSQLAVHPDQPLVRVQRNTSEHDTMLAWQEQSLTYLEETLLRHLLTHANAVQTAEVLFQAVWPDEEFDPIGLRPDQKDRLRRLAYQLRKRIEPEPRNPQYLQTAHGVGYALYGNVQAGGEA